MVRLFTPLILCIFGLFIASYSYITYADFSAYGAAFYPTIIGCLVALFSLMDFVMELKIRHAYVVQSINLNHQLKAVGFVCFAIVFYIVFSERIGFILTTGLILILMALPWVKKNKILTALFLMLVSAAIYGVFAQVLQVALPTGALFE
ncbi:tripartite tricarboxylate transporter TctB family protein [Conservatibacter flavescens]|uniref:DUF1468 domain-containing protein n=1 Tax=Conservatibacter flavescens TaxID=28161 RepID=A0A2M8S3J5_9PAST|nr:tripartite tricarboxylate transporter TctB family protein [Conservatibacter flavescens]PJG85729.1 hypothetical protein CVP05_04085 [Conservatibacter flavescens]